MNLVVNAMDNFKENVYARAGVSLENEIQYMRNQIIYLQYTRQNYPHSPGGTNFIDAGHSEDYMDQCEADDILLLDEKIARRGSVKRNVIQMDSDIYKKMSDHKMTPSKIKKLAFLFDKFMKLTGLPWILDIYTPKWNEFLLKSWDNSMIPVDIEGVWFTIPRICAAFIREFTLSRHLRTGVPSIFRIVDGPVGRNSHPGAVI